MTRARRDLGPRPSVADGDGAGPGSGSSTGWLTFTPAPASTGPEAGEGAAAVGRGGRDQLHDDPHPLDPVELVEDLPASSSSRARVREISPVAGSPASR